MAGICGLDINYINYKKIIKNGLMLFLDAANLASYPKTGNIWYDISGNNRNGTLINSPLYVDNNGGGIAFNGTNYVSTTYDLSWNNTNSVTILLYMKPDSVSSGTSRNFIGKSTFEWQIMQLNNELQFVYFTSGGGHGNGPAGTVNYTTFDTNFIHLSMVWNHIDNKYYFYKNSILLATINWVDASINADTSDTISIGGNIYPWSGRTSWSGIISQILIYNRALSQSEISQNFNATRKRFGI